MPNEIDYVNDCIFNNDFDSFENFINIKNDMTKEVEKNSMLEKVGDLWQFIMDQAYDLWDSVNYTDFLNKLPQYEKIAVQFGKFNQQLQCNGLYGWEDNGYSEDLDDITKFIKNSNFKMKNEFLSILEAFDNVKVAVCKLDRFDDWYEADFNTRWDSLKFFDEMYDRIHEEWNEYFQNYLFDNMPQSYKEKINNYKKDISI